MAFKSSLRKLVLLYVLVLRDCFMILFFSFIVEIQVSSKQEVVDALVKEQFSMDVARV